MVIVAARFLGAMALIRLTKRSKLEWLVALNALTLVEK
jgi:hypothetical protein